MLKLAPNKFLVQAVSELPRMDHAEMLFQDFETASTDPSEGGRNPYLGDRICGIAVTRDDCPDSYYVPIRHVDAHWNLPLEPVLKWMRLNTETCKSWINHNVKFDMHFAHIDGADLGYSWKGRAVCTLVQSKIVHSDRGFGGPGYGLDELLLDWCNWDISALYKRVRTYLDGIKLERNKKANDYALVPADILGEYACGDVLGNRELYLEIIKRLPEECRRVSENEIRLTPAIFDMEVAGMRVDPAKLRQEKLITIHRLMAMEEALNKEVGFPVRPNVSEDCFELICNYFGLPVLKWNEPDEDDEESIEKEPTPSFDKEALTSYLSHPVVVADPRIKRCIELVRAFRKDHTTLTYFINKYIDLEVGGTLHPNYTQVVRTARMACKDPNAQQLSTRAKELIIPGPGDAFLCDDYNQIEFRLIGHYIRDPGIIQAFIENPDTDFHSLVAEWCGTSRGPGKTINFTVAFGGGKKRVLATLAKNMELVGKFGEEIDVWIARGELEASRRFEVFEILCQRRAEEVYNTYHATLPGIKRTTKVAARNCEHRGYTFNLLGRRRHLPVRVAWRAFNSAVQSSAADIMKERALAVAPRYCAYTRERNITHSALVHDENKFRGPAEVLADPRVRATLLCLLEDDRAFNLRVPLRASCGYSTKSWAEASGKAGRVEVDRGLADPSALDQGAREQVAR